MSTAGVQVVLAVPAENEHARSFGNHFVLCLDARGELLACSIRLSWRRARILSRSGRLSASDTGWLRPRFVRKLSSWSWAHVRALEVDEGLLLEILPRRPARRAPRLRLVPPREGAP
jgi:hypothetical protein